VGGRQLFPNPIPDESVLKRTWNSYRMVMSTKPKIAFARAAESSLVAVMGDRKGAARLFRDSWQSDWLEPFGMMREAAPRTEGCFLTNYGSLLRTAMLGFTGLRVNEGEWNKFEATLPENWNSIEIERIYIRGQEKRISAHHGKKAEISEM